MHNIFNIHDSTIGVLTSGQQVSLRNIEINVRSLTRSETGPVALALQQLTKAVAESAQLAADNKAAVLECLEELSSQATLQAGQRSKPGAVRAVLDSLQSSLAAGGSFAEIWATWGPVLRTYFGV